MDVHTLVPSCEHSEAKLPAFIQECLSFPVIVTPQFICPLDETTYASRAETLTPLLPPMLCALQNWTEAGDSAVAEESQSYTVSETDSLWKASTSLAHTRMPESWFGTLSPPGSIWDPHHSG